MAESAVIGPCTTLLAFVTLMITYSPTFSWIQMKWSDSSVNVYQGQLVGGLASLLLYLMVSVSALRLVMVLVYLLLY